MRPNLNSSASDLWRSTASLSPAVAPPRSSDRTSVRLKIVEEHVRLENQHDLDGVMGTFGATAHYDDQPWGEHYAGLDGVRAYYTAGSCRLSGWWRPDGGAGLRDGLA